MKKEIPAPFIPHLKTETDVTYFDPEFTEQPMSFSEKDTMIK